MRVRPLFAVIFLSISFGSIASAQHAPICDVTCGPDPGSTGFAVLGAGVLGGIQYTRSTGRTIFDLRGSATSAGVSGAISGVGVGIDGASSKTADSVTLTVGAGIGGKGAGFARTGTAVPGWLSIDCGPK